MLVFTRKVGDAIVIGGGIEVKVLRIGREGVRIGVTAALDVPVHRSEVYSQIRDANASSVEDATGAHNLVSRLRHKAAVPAGPSTDVHRP